MARAHSPYQPAALRAEQWRQASPNGLSMATGYTPAARVIIPAPLVTSF
jgi:hypothetical protein